MRTAPISAGQILVGRRTVILGAAGLLVAACTTDPKGDKPNASGPVIATPDTGNVVTPEDVAALAERFNQAFEAHDLPALMKAGGPDVTDSFGFETRWSRRLRTFDRIGLVKGEWFVGLPSGRTRNASGGLVEFSGTLVFAHQVRDCDGQQVVETFTCDMRKESIDAPLRVTDIGADTSTFDPSIWDVADDIDAIETPHARILFRGQDAQQAKALQSRVERGAARAFDLMPRPKGVSKVLFALTWPDVQDELWGGAAIGESDANLFRHAFLDPDSLANGQKKKASSPGLPRATGRVGLHASSFGRSDFEDVACHEAIHALAEQWTGDRSPGTPVWAIEGLARWGDSRPGTDRLLNTHGSAIRAWYPQFEKLDHGSYDDFHRGAREEDNYLCAAAVYEYLDQQMGRDAVMETAQYFYGPTDRDKMSPENTMKRQSKLLAAAGKWLRA